MTEFIEPAERAIITVAALWGCLLLFAAVAILVTNVVDNLRR